MRNYAKRTRTARGREKSEENLLSALPDAPVYQKNMYKINRGRRRGGEHQAEKSAYSHERILNTLRVRKNKIRYSIQLLLYKVITLEGNWFHSRNLGFITNLPLVEWGGGTQGNSVRVGNVRLAKMLPQSIRDVRVPDLSGVCMQLPKINTWHPNPTPPLPFYLSLSHLLSFSFDPIPCNCIRFSCSSHVFPPHLFVFNFFLFFCHLQLARIFYIFVACE